MVSFLPHTEFFTSYCWEEQPYNPMFNGGNQEERHYDDGDDYFDKIIEK